MKKIIIIYLMAALIPMSIIGGGLYWALNKNATLERYKHTKGEIIEINKKKLHEFDKGYYYPKVRYYDDKGEPYTFEFKIGSERYPGGMGEEIDLLFNPSHPEDVIVDSFLSKWLGPVMVCAVGFLILILVIIVTAVSMLRKRKQEKI